MNENNKRKLVFANKLHQQIFLLVSLAALLPTTIVTIGLYYVIFGIFANEVAIPESIAYNIIPAAKKVALVIFIATPIVMGVMIFLAWKISHAIIGPFDRIVRELDERIEGKIIGHILVRKKDKFQPLVERINKLLDKTQR
jgi:sensor histidine kinase YesM